MDHASYAISVTVTATTTPGGTPYNFDPLLHASFQSRSCLQSVGAETQTLRQMITAEMNMDTQRSRFAALRLAGRAKRWETSPKFPSMSCTRSALQHLKLLVASINLTGAADHQIFCLLHPKDLLRLSWCTKSLRAVLTSRSSRFVWATALAAIEGLPPCPQGLTEITYSNLLFHPYCCVRCHHSP